MRFAPHRWLVAVLSGALLMSAPTVSVADDPDLASLDVVPTGASEESAAASCWEVKQVQPQAASGPYWLLTPSMDTPQQFYCDMTTDGGGWVRVGVGRHAWSTSYEGVGNAQALLQAAPSPTTRAQLPARTIDALLDGRRVDSLDDGIRVRRARVVDGSQWQEVRVKYTQRDRWVWTFGAEHRVGAWSFDGISGSGGQTNNFGVGQLTNRVSTTVQESQNWGWGFAYGTSVRGEPGDNSYLWSSNTAVGAARPVAEVYLRPKLTQATVQFARVPDGGTTQVSQVAVPSSAAQVNPWAVNGLAGSTSGEGQVEVQVIEQIGTTMYLGGNFRWVQRDQAGAGRTDQPFLAAFDLTTGEFRPAFRPRLNEAVKSLAALPNGDLAVGGVFTQANGQPVQGLVAVDAVTGETAENWGVSIENNLSVGAVLVRSLAVHGDYLYVGGNFTHLSRPDGTGRVYARAGARVSVQDGTPDRWNPWFSGSVIDLDPSTHGDRVYFAGYFETAQSLPAKNAAAVRTDSSAALVPTPWNPVWSAAKSYQQGIKEAGDRVWVGGSEHSLFSFDRATFERLSGNITKRGGDFQVADAGFARLYAGCHCNDFSYTNAYTWSNVGTTWTQADAIGWFGAWDVATGSFVPDFAPEMSMRKGEGVWAIKVASDGSVWAGGDISNGRTTAGNRWLGGFARFLPRDVDPPSTPSGFTSTTRTAESVTLTWGASAGASRYQVLRDDRVIATTAQRTVTVPRGGEDRFFIRAVDAAGNTSASTSVLALGAASPVAMIDVEVSGLLVSVDGSASLDPDGSVVEHAWEFGDGVVASGAAAVHEYAQAGEYTITLTVTDDDGLTDSVTEVVQVEPSTDPVTVRVVHPDAEWRWAYSPAAPPPDWRTVGADLSDWEVGAAPLGFGFAGVGTDIDVDGPVADRGIAAQFVREFEIDDRARVVSLHVEAVADDGAVVYVNGVEVGRHNMRDGEITHQSYAASSRRRQVAVNDKLVVQVPIELLVEGTNVLAASSHVLYRGTPDLSFDLTADLTLQPPAR